MKSFFIKTLVFLSFGAFISSQTHCFRNPFEDLEIQASENIELIKKQIIAKGDHPSFLDWYSAHNQEPLACTLTYLYLKHDLPRSFLNDFLSKGREFWAVTTTTHGCTPLMMAAHAGDDQLVNDLLNLLTIDDIECESSEGCSAIDYAQCQVSALTFTEWLYYGEVDKHDIAADSIHTKVRQLMRKNYLYSLIKTANNNGVFSYLKYLMEDIGPILCENHTVGYVTGNCIDISNIIRQIEGNDELIETIRKAVNREIFRDRYFIPLSEYLYRGSGYLFIKKTTGTSIVNATELKDTDLVRSFIEAGYDVNASTENGYTALWCAAANCNLEMVKMLLAAPGIDVNKVNCVGETPLIALITYGFNKDTALEILKLFLNHPKVDVNKKNNDGSTPLMIALCRSGSRESARSVGLLLNDQNIDLAATNDRGETALHVATRCVGWGIGENAEYFEQLVSLCDDTILNAKTCYGSTAMDIVLIGQLNFLIKPLKTAGAKTAQELEN